MTTEQLTSFGQIFRVVHTVIRFRFDSQVTVSDSGWAVHCTHFITPPTPMPLGNRTCQSSQPDGRTSPINALVEKAKPAQFDNLLALIVKVVQFLLESPDFLAPTTTRIYPPYRTGRPGMV